MPIEIRELVIRTVVEPGRAPARAGLRPEELEQLKREILRQCLTRLAQERATQARR